ncbi:transcriptional regulator [Actinocatenispora comari]|uniref:Transcriptional regulator n=1 Tax=Actinocatenispora comari TaxID=2807577 RepID=A0A8J4EN16_9ACTN|nr:transcriptional regulator [Actinocatenispora comari]
MAGSVPGAGDATYCFGWSRKMGGAAVPLRIRFGADDLARCRFALSPLCETHEAVRTLRRARRHAYHLPWLRRARDAARGLDLTELSLLMPDPGYTPDFLGPPPTTPYTTVASFADELDRLARTDVELARSELRRSLDSTPGAEESAAGRRLLADPAAAVRRLAVVTEQAWHALVAPDWPRIRTLLEADIAYRARRLAVGGLRALFADLHPRLRFADDTLTVLTADGTPRRQELAGRGLLLMPSVFCWPEPIGGFAPPWQPTVIYPARGIDGLWRPGPAAPAALARLLGPNRAAVLAALTEPATTTALAERLRLAVSSVSAHLAILRDAGLVTAHRAGRHVRYQRTAVGAILTTDPR